MTPKYKTLTAEQKAEIAELCKEIVKLSVQARHEGLLALDEKISDAEAAFKEIPKSKKFFFVLLRLIVDGTNEDSLSIIVDNLLDSSADDDFEKLAFTLAKTGALAFQRGDNPFLVERLLLSILGFDAEEEICAATGFKRWNESLW
ncbi:MAG: hypothetical protein IKP49_01540 [Treponema sp.]|nr:hypothetical protein [Treponema sp.]